MFKTIWFDDNLDGKILKDSKTRPMQDDDGTAVAGAKLNDLYNQNRNPANIEAIWEWLTDSNMDLTADDLGKSDLLSSKDDRSTVDDERTIFVESCAPRTSYDPDDGPMTALDDVPCKGGTAAAPTTAARTRSGTDIATHPDGNADNYETAGTRADVEHSTTAENTAANRTVADADADFYECSENDGGDDDDGSICDAEWVNDVEVVFADGTFGASTTRMVTVTCTWDADGGMAQGRNALPSAFDGNGEGSNLANFLKCEAE